jgi:Ice-binding-like
MRIRSGKNAADATAAAAQADLTTAYNDAASRTPATSVSGDLGGQTLTPRVYNSTSTLRAAPPPAPQGALPEAVALPA